MSVSLTGRTQVDQNYGCPILQPRYSRVTRTRTTVSHSALCLIKLNLIYHSTDTVPENADIYFKPLIPLPDLVEVKTGEEDETVIYCQRAKLYRYEPQTKEWKERGVGDFKILKHNFKSMLLLY